MFTQIAILWTLLTLETSKLRNQDEDGSVVETVIITAVFAALAIAIGAIIVSKVTAKANSVNLN